MKSSSTAALAASRARAAAAVEAAAVPLERLQRANEALAAAKERLNEFDTLAAFEWSNWASSGIGRQPSPNEDGRAKILASISAAEASVAASQAAAPPFARALIHAQQSFAIADAALRKSQLADILSAAEVIAEQYLEASAHAASIRDKLVGIDRFIDNNFKDCHINGHSIGNESRVAGIRHNRNSMPPSFIITGFDLKTLEGKVTIVIPINEASVVEGWKIAANVIAGD